MHNAMLLAVALIGQCSGGSCPAPSFGGFGGFTPMSTQTFVLPAAAPVQATPLGRYPIDHEGMSFTVEGYKLPNNGGKVTWFEDRPFNVKALADAKVKVKAAEKAKYEAEVRAKVEAEYKVKAEKAESARLAAIPKAPSRPDPEPIGQLPYQTNGVSADKIPLNRDKVTADSREAKRFMAEAVGGADPEADEGIHLTLIGTEADCKPVLNDLANHPDLKPFKGLVEVQDYDPGHWAVKGIYPAGRPAILIQTAIPGSKMGRVVFRAEDYAGGPAKLAEELRKANPKYDPKLDPGIKPEPAPIPPPRPKCPFGFTSAHWPAIFIVGLIVLVLCWKPKGASRVQ